jgi:hypothetical protein
MKTWIVSCADGSYRTARPLCGREQEFCTRFAHHAAVFGPTARKSGKDGRVDRP